MEPAADQGAAGSTGIAGSGPAGKGGGAAGAPAARVWRTARARRELPDSRALAGRGGATGAAGDRPGRQRGRRLGSRGTPASGGAGLAAHRQRRGRSFARCLQAAIGYRNLFRELLGKAQQDTDAKAAAAFQSLFHGGSNATVYYESGTDEAYILDGVCATLRRRAWVKFWYPSPCP